MGRPANACEAYIPFIGVEPLQVFPVSALHGKGVAELKSWAVAQLHEGPSLYPKVSTILSS